jgi:cystathionine gamma-synthase
MTDRTHKTLKPATIAAQALGWIDEETRGIVAPLHMSTTFVRDADNQYRTGRIYGRDNNPTYDQAEAVITALEGGRSSLLFASGMAAATAVFQALAPGDHVLAPKVMYWSLRNWLLNFATHWGLQVEFIDMSDPAILRNAVKSGRTKIVWVETPANPMWTITDIALAAEIAHAAGAVLAVDSTTASPVLTRPLSLGADLVMHAATKYLNGHSDVIAGTLTTRDESPLWLRIRTVRAQIGGIAGPFEAWLLTRGMRTLFPRVRAACQSAQAIAEHFSRHPRVEEVLYPGLPTFVGHDVARRQMQGGFGGMLSIRIRGNVRGAASDSAGNAARDATGEKAAIATAANVQIWKRATSLGGVESLIEHRASVEGAGTPAPPNLLRLSVGLEEVGDLIDDLQQAIEAA